MEPVEEEAIEIEIIEEPEEPEIEIYEPQIIDVQFSLELRQQSILDSMTGLVNFTHPLNMTYLANQTIFDSIFEISVFYGNGSDRYENIKSQSYTLLDKPSLSSEQGSIFLEKQLSEQAELSKQGEIIL